MDHMLVVEWKSSQPAQPIWGIKINDQEDKALIDEQAGLNCMSYDFVKRAGLKPIVHDCDDTALKFQLCNGHPCFTIGMVTLRDCRVKEIQKVKGPLGLKHETSVIHAIGRQDFYIYPRTIRPVILGLPFLTKAKATGLSLQPVGSRLSENVQSYNWVMAFTTANTPRGANDGPRAMPNISAELNMMSLNHASQYHGFLEDKEVGHIETKPAVILELGTKRKVPALGLVDKPLGFATPPRAAEKLYSFAVIKNLVPDLLVGNDLLSEKAIPPNPSSEATGRPGLYASRIAEKSGFVNPKQQDKDEQEASRRDRIRMRSAGKLKK